MLIDAGTHWRLAWRTFGLYDDGWTRPAAPMTMRVYAAAGQRTAVLRSVAFVLRALPGARHSVTFTTGPGTTRLVVTGNDVQEIVNVCVPPHGYGVLRMSVHGSSPIPGDLATRPRSGGHGAAGSSSPR